MKRFDPQSINERLTQRLMRKEEWSNVLSEGTLGNLVSSISESEAEIARYIEYLFLEKKWKTARNLTSLTHMGDLIGKKVELARSAVGFVVVTHTDPDRKNRLKNFGSVFFDLDQASDYDNTFQNQRSTYTERCALTPWLSPYHYEIPKGTTFLTSSSVEFVALETKKIKQLTEPWDSIQSNEDRLFEFYLSGGWNGIKYLKVPVIQGKPTTISLGVAQGKRFESFAVESSTIEAGDNDISKVYFKVLVAPVLLGSDIEEEWEKIDNVRLAGPYDRVYETKYSVETGRLIIKFGDGITGRLLAKGSRVTFKYLDTKGAEGNVTQKFQVTTMVLPGGDSQVDPRTNKKEEFLSCTNVIPIMGGKNVEEDSEYKKNAPASYLKSYTTSTIDSYEDQIRKRSPISVLHLNVWQGPVTEAMSYGNDGEKFLSNVSGGVLQEVTRSKKALIVSAIRANGTKFEDPHDELIEPIIRSLHDKKSPNDTITYLEPDFINVRANVVVHTKESITDSEVRDKVTEQVLNEYSVFNSGFQKPLYKSQIDRLAKQLSFSENSSSILEARAVVDYKPLILSNETKSLEVLADPKAKLAFNFKFSRVFSRDLATCGFQNFKYSSDFLIRADVRFTEHPELDKSFFLYDNRIDKGRVVELMEAEWLRIDESKAVPIKLRETYPGFGDYFVFNEYDDTFQNRQVRTAQYSFVKDITTRTFMARLSGFTAEPYEDRPLYVDEFGVKKMFNTKDVPDDERVSTTLVGPVTGNKCFRRNTKYYEDTKILFTENYEQPTSVKYANGFLVVPLDRIMTKQDLDDLNMIMEYTESTDSLRDEIQRSMIGKVKIDVFARPVSVDVHPVHKHQIVFINEDDVVVEKVYVSS